MRVLTVIETLGAAGAERALVALLPAMQARGHHCEVAVLRPPLTIAQDLREIGVIVHDLGLRHRWDIPKGVAGVRNLARRHRFDVLHGHLFFAGVYVALARPLLPGVAGVVTFHNLGYDSFPADSAWRRVRKLLDQALMRSVDRRVAVSQAVADHYRSHLGVEQIEVVPNGLDLAAIAHRRASRAVVLTRLGLDPARPVLVAVGRFVPEKAYGDLVAAVAAVRSQGCPAQLVVLGDGPGRPGVEAALRHIDIGTDAVLAGVRPHDEVLDTVAAADVFVSSSTHEGFPLAPTEAMALGRPMAVTAVGGIPEIVGEDGASVLVRPGHPDELARIILEQLRDPDAAAARAEKGRHRALDCFDVATTALHIERVYDAALAHRRGR